MSPANVRPRRGAAFASPLRLGLCCTFAQEPIRFRRTTARYLASLEAAGRREHLRRLIRANVEALAAAVSWCASHAVAAFRVNSEIWPVYTHPTQGYQLTSLDPGGELRGAFQAVGKQARQVGVRLSFHPDQFVVLNSVRPEVVASGLAELEYQAQVAELLGAEQITVHGGGAQGGKAAALDRLRRAADRLSPRVRQRLALENDDRVFSVADLLPVCQKLGVPLVYDVHHHRCNPDELGEREATEAAATTWGTREPWVHISSPLGGWSAGRPCSHADYIRLRDLPDCWVGRWQTIDVEAKRKELAVLRLLAAVRRRQS